jgi:hypothetical protein
LYFDSAETAKKTEKEMQIFNLQCLGWQLKKYAVDKKYFSYKVLITNKEKVKGGITYIVGDTTYQDTSGSYIVP